MTNRPASVGRERVPGVGTGVKGVSRRRTVSTGGLAAAAIANTTANVNPTGMVKMGGAAQLNLTLNMPFHGYVAEPRNAPQ
eukprot:7343116-Pyramimonas_sp.AAC.1